MADSSSGAGDTWVEPEAYCTIREQEKYKRGHN